MSCSNGILWTSKAAANGYGNFCSWIVWDRIVKRIRNIASWLSRFCQLILINNIPIPRKCTFTFFQRNLFILSVITIGISSYSFRPTSSCLSISFMPFRFEWTEKILESLNIHVRIYLILHLIKNKYIILFRISSPWITGHPFWRTSFALSTTQVNQFTVDQIWRQFSNTVEGIGSRGSINNIVCAFITFSLEILWTIKNQESFLPGILFFFCPSFSLNGQSWPTS